MSPNGSLVPLSYLVKNLFRYIKNFNLKIKTELVT